jgi:DNA-nicking Smr family endonuclease
MTPDDKKIWDEISQTVKPLKKKPKSSEEVPAVPRKEETVKKGEILQEPFEIKQKETPSLEKKSSFQPQISLTQSRLLTRKFKQGSCRVQGTLDLHGQTQDEAYASLKRFLTQAVQQRKKLVLIITGKGRSQNRMSSEGKSEHSFSSSGVLREKTPGWLENTAQFPEVLSVSMARPQDGGAGAFYVELRSPKNENI